MQNFNIGIIGLGAIGSLLAAILSLEDKSNIFYIDERTSALNEYEKEYIFEDLNKNNHIIKIKRYNSKSNIRLDLLILTTKTYQSKIAITQISKFISQSTPLLCLQNGMGNKEILQQLIHNPIIMGTITCGALKNENKTIYTGIGKIIFDGTTAFSQILKKQLKNNFLSIEESYNITEIMLYKLAVNSVINTITTIYELKNGEITKHPKLIDLLIKEIIQIYQRIGCNFTNEFLKDAILNIANKTQNNYSSMHEDIKKGRNTEIDSILGYLLNIGKRENIETPTIFNIYQQILKQQRIKND